MTKDEALKLALEGLEKWHFDKDPRGAADYIAAIKEVLAQPQRTWVDLTDDERMELAVSTGAMSADWLPFMEAVEAKLKEKNT